MGMESKAQEPEQYGRINITYEALFDLVVREKSRDDLQALSANFFTELVNYLNEKRSALEILGIDEKEKASRQLQNINRLIKELYERREKKIISLALARSRAGVDIIDTSTLLSEEKSLFDGTVRQLDFYRENVLNSLLSAKVPKTIQQTGAETLAAASRIITDAPISAIGGVNQATAAAEEQGKTENATRLVRFLHAVPRFVGSELEIYGPFDQEDIANLPREIAAVLITKGRAEEIAKA